MDLQTIRNQYAQEQGYDDWNELDMLSGQEEMTKHIDEICIRAEKAALEKAAKNLRQCSGSFNSDYFSQKASITNEQNLIL